MQASIGVRNDIKRSVQKSVLDNILSEMQKDIKPDMYSILYSSNGINAYFKSDGTSLDANETRNIFDITGKIRLYNALILTDYDTIITKIYGSGTDDKFMHPYRDAYDLYSVLGYEDWWGNWELLLYDNSNNKYAVFRLWGRAEGLGYNGEIKIDIWNTDPVNSHNAYVYFAYGRQTSLHLYFKDYTKLRYKNMDIHRAIMKVLGLKFGDITVERRTKIEEKKKKWDFDIYIHKDINNKQIEMVKEVIKKITSVPKKNIGLDEL